MSINERFVKQYDLQQMSITQLHAQIRSDFDGYPLHPPRHKLRLVTEYVEWLLGGTKSTTVRYRPNAIDVPAALELPLIESVHGDNNNADSNADDHQVGTVRITRIIIKPFGMLDDQDAHQDGFSTEHELKEALQWLYAPTYGHISDDQYVSIYTIHLVGRAM